MQTIEMEKMVVVNGETPANAYFMNKLQDNMADAITDVQNSVKDAMKSQETSSDEDTYNCNFINKLIPNAITDNYINVSSGSLNKNHSFKIGDAIFLELKFTGVTLSSSSLMVIATLNSSLVPSSEVTIMASTDKGGVTYGWIRTNGEIVIKTSVAGSNADVRINAFYL